MANLPPEDQRPKFRLVPGDPAKAEAAVGPKSPYNPIYVGKEFLENKDNPTKLARLVTPESLESWGNFKEVAERLNGCGIATNREESSDPDVVYVKYVTSDKEGYLVVEADDDVLTLIRAVGTLVLREDLGGWRVHHVGDRVRPEDVPH